MWFDTECLEIDFKDGSKKDHLEIDVRNMNPGVNALGITGVVLVFLRQEDALPPTRIRSVTFFVASDEAQVPDVLKVAIQGLFGERAGIETLVKIPTKK